MRADQLSYRLKLRTNGIKQSLARRNKFHMGEAVRKAGATLASCHIYNAVLNEMPRHCLSQLLLHYDELYNICI